MVVDGERQGQSPVAKAERAVDRTARLLTGPFDDAALTIRRERTRPPWGSLGKRGPGRRSVR